MQATLEQPVVEATPEPDHLGVAVLRNLSRSYWNQYSTSAIRLGLLALLTLGAWPVIRMRRQLRNYVTFERQHFWYLAEWLRTRLGGEQAELLTDSVRKMGYLRRLQW